MSCYGVCAWHSAGGSHRLGRSHSAAQSNRPKPLGGVRADGAAFFVDKARPQSAAAKSPPGTSASSSCQGAIRNHRTECRTAYQEQDAIANSPLSVFSETMRPSTLIQHLTSPAAREPGVWRVLTAKCWSGVEG